MTVICMFEEDHGCIGIAKDYNSAIHFLLRNDWLNVTCTVIDKNNEEGYIDDVYGNNWRTVVASWDIQTFNQNVISFRLKEKEIHAHS